MKLTRLGELFLLEQLRKSFKKKSENILVGIGDDAAVIKPLDKNLLVTTDMMVEKIHFNLNYITSYQLGFKLISINVSDIYAMGGYPLYVLLNIALKRDTDIIFFNILLDGIQDALKKYNTILVGGDLSNTNTDMILSATIIGYSKNYIGRKGAVKGDKIYVTGYLGDSACGFELLKKIKKPVPLGIKSSTPTHPPFTKVGNREGLNSDFQTLKSKLLKLGFSWDTVEPLLRRHLMPVARNPKIFRDATSMIDISDGLLIDLSRLCNESKVGARIYREKIPLSPEIKKTASCLGLDPMELALSGGEDYELLFTAPSKKRVKAIHIGEITKSERVIVYKSGKEEPFTAKGYQHFAIRGNR